MALEWIYHRQELAENLASDYADLGVDRLAMFANRQKGKTHFCTHDLIPAMREKGFFCVYVDFWSKKNDPELSLAEGVAQAYERLSLFQKPLKIDAFKLSTAKGGGLKAELGITMDAPQSSTQAADAAIAWVLRMADVKPVFIVLDEIQHLATDAAFESFTAKLRSFLINKAQLCKHPIKAMFIGSDQTRLAELFKSSRAPFYKATSVSDFEELGKHFTDHIVNCFEKAREPNCLDRSEAYRLFNDGGRLPGSFIGLLQKMASAKRYDLRQAAEDYGYFVDAQALYREQLAKLNEQDIAVLALLARGWQNLYTKQTLGIIGNLAGKGGAVTKSSVQSTLRKLGKRNLIITKGYGVWELEDSSMGDWIKENSREVSDYLTDRDLKNAEYGTL